LYPIKAKLCLAALLKVLTSLNLFRGHEAQVHEATDASGQYAVSPAKAQQLAPIYIFGLS